MKEKLQVLANLLHLRTAFMQACHDAKVPYSQTEVAAKVDFGGKIAERYPITDISYDKTTNTVIVHVDASMIYDPAIVD